MAICREDSFPLWAVKVLRRRSHQSVLTTFVPSLSNQFGALLLSGPPAVPKPEAEATLECLDRVPF